MGGRKMIGDSVPVAAQPRLHEKELPRTDTASGTFSGTIKSTVLEEGARSLTKTQRIAIISTVKKLAKRFLSLADRAFYLDPDINSGNACHKLRLAQELIHVGLTERAMQFIDQAVRTESGDDVEDLNVQLRGAQLAVCAGDCKKAKEYFAKSKELVQQMRLWEKLAPKPTPADSIEWVGVSFQRHLGLTSNSWNFKRKLAVTEEAIILAETDPLRFDKCKQRLLRRVLENDGHHYHTAGRSERITHPLAEIDGNPVFELVPKLLADLDDGSDVDFDFLNALGALRTAKQIEVLSKNIADEDTRQTILGAMLAGRSRMLMLFAFNDEDAKEIIRLYPHRSKYLPEDETGLTNPIFSRERKHADENYQNALTITLRLSIQYSRWRDTKRLIPHARLFLSHGNPKLYAVPFKRGSKELSPKDPRHFALLKALVCLNEPVANTLVFETIVQRDPCSIAQAWSLLQDLGTNGHLDSFMTRYLVEDVATFSETAMDPSKVSEQRKALHLESINYFMNFSHTIPDSGLMKYLLKNSKTEQEITAKINGLLEFSRVFSEFEQPEKLLAFLLANESNEDKYLLSQGSRLCRYRSVGRFGSETFHEMISYARELIGSPDKKGHLGPYNEALDLFGSVRRRKAYRLFNDGIQLFTVDAEFIDSKQLESLFFVPIMIQRAINGPVLGNDTFNVKCGKVDSLPQADYLSLYYPYFVWPEHLPKHTALFPPWFELFCQKTLIQQARNVFGPRRLGTMLKFIIYPLLAEIPDESKKRLVNCGNFEQIAQEVSKIESSNPKIVALAINSAGRLWREEIEPAFGISIRDVLFAPDISPVVERQPIEVSATVSESEADVLKPLFPQYSSYSELLDHQERFFQIKNPKLLATMAKEKLDRFAKTLTRNQVINDATMVQKTWKQESHLWADDLESSHVARRRLQNTFFITSKERMIIRWLPKIKLLPWMRFGDAAPSCLSSNKHSTLRNPFIVDPKKEIPKYYADPLTFVFNIDVFSAEEGGAGKYTTVGFVLGGYGKVDGKLAVFLESVMLLHKDPDLIKAILDAIEVNFSKKIGAEYQVVSVRFNPEFEGYYMPEGVKLKRLVAVKDPESPGGPIHKLYNDFGYDETEKSGIPVNTEVDPNPNIRIKKLV